MALRPEEESQLNQLLSNQRSGILPGIARTRANIVKNRGDAFDAYNKRTSGAVTQLGLPPDLMAAAAPAFGRVSTKLDAQLSKNLNQRQINERRANLNNVYSTALRRAINAGQDYTSAQQYAAQQASIASQQAFEANTAQAERDKQAEINRIKIQYGQAAANLKNEFLPNQQSYYEQALIRSLFGLGGSLGSAYVMNKYNNGRFGGGVDQTPIYNPEQSVSAPTVAPETPSSY